MAAFLVGSLLNVMTSDKLLYIYKLVSSLLIKYNKAFICYFHYIAGNIIYIIIFYLFLNNDRLIFTTYLDRQSCPLIAVF